MALIPLSRLFLETRPAGVPAAFAAEGPLPFDRLLHEASSISGGVRPGRWLLAQEPAWDFAAGLLGLLWAGCDVLLPPNFLPETLEALGREADGVLGQAPAPGPRTAKPVPLGGRIEFRTSGSTGEPKSVLKTLPQLEAEISVLEAAFGEGLGEGPVVGTVPHHHIYGCLFRILWPLASGRPFEVEPCGAPDAFARALQGPHRPVLVSSPAHLSRLPALVDLDRAPSPPRRVFSSGGPLRLEDAFAWRRWVPEGVVEIYGSTESGGIAWRSQSEGPGGALWRPLPDVEVSFEADGALRVHSPRASLRLEDAAEPGPDGTFRLLGRLDRIVKLEEKRVALPELEAAPEGAPEVAQAGVCLLETPRPALGAVVVPARGCPRSAQERRHLAKVLRQRLSGRFDAAALPKRWRFVEALPYDARGKLTAPALAALFNAPE